MLTKLSYFTSKPRLIPGAQTLPTIGSVPSGVASLTTFLEDTEKELIKNAIGFVDQIELYTHISSAGLSAAAPQKYKDLVNGSTYTIDGVDYQWGGLLGNDGILANYGFCKWMDSDLSVYTTVGIQAPEAEGSNRVSAIPMWVDAWRRFISLYQSDDSVMPRIYNVGGGIGIDWFGSGNKVVSLYKFLNDSDVFTTDYFQLEYNENRWQL